MNKYLKAFLITITCCAIFFLCGEPFRDILKLSEGTEVRPVAAFPLLFGIAFGFWGTFGCAIGNLISDYLGGYPPICLFFGFLIQIAYGYLPALIFNYLRRHDQNKYRLNRVSKIVQYLVLILFDSLLSSYLVWTLIHFVFGPPEFGLGFWNTFFNQLIFFIILGIPALCLFSVIKQLVENKKKNLDTHQFILFSLNEKFILFFVAFSIVISIIASIGAYFYFDEIYAEDPMHLWSYVYFMCGGSLFLALCPALIFLYFIERDVSKPLERMASSAKAFTKEDDIHLIIEKIIMKCQKYLYFSTEIGDMARSQKIMASELEDYVNNLAKITAEKENNATQLKIATNIQLGALPKPIEIKGADLYATMKPALEVGGDFYDFFMIDDNHLALVVADVSGKGVPAALFMMISKIILRKNLKNGMSPADAMTLTNQELCDNNPAEMFVTCLCGVLDLTTNVLIFANAGHEKPAIARKGEKFYLPNIKSGFVLGGMPGMKYKEFQVQLNPGDMLFTYTDGIPEAMSPSNEEFGNDRMLSVLNAANEKEKPLSEICDDMKKAIFDFNDTAPQFDDITMLLIKIRENAAL